MIQEPVLKFVVGLQALLLVVGGVLTALGTIDATAFYANIVSAVVAFVGSLLARAKVSPVE